MIAPAGKPAQDDRMVRSWSGEERTISALPWELCDLCLVCTTNRPSLEAPPKGGASGFVGEVWYDAGMTNAQLNKQIGDIVEQKLLEFFGDPDEGRELKKSFVTDLRKRLKEKQKTIPMSVVAKKYGLR